MICVLCTSTND